MPEGKAWADAAVIAAFVGAVATITVADMNVDDAGRQRGLQSEQRSDDIRNQAYKTYLESRRDICAATIRYFEDERPKPLKGDEEARVSNAMAANLEKCSVVDLPALPTPNSNANTVAASPVEDVRVDARPDAAKFGGGDSGGGGASGKR